MSLRLFLLCCCWFALGSLPAQKHDYNWVTGFDFNYPDPKGNMRIDFNHSPPKIHNENLMMNFQACRGSFSDSAGNLLLYTNGIRIFNKNRQLMEGGDTINPGQVWKNSEAYGYVTLYPVVALPLPGSDGIHYLFHSDVVNGGNVSFSYTKHFYYTIIDLNANGGLGKVLAKNQVLMDGEIMFPAFVKHGNGRDWWIMGMQRADTRHYLYLLDPQGIKGPFIQDIGPPFLPTEYEGENLFSENGALFLRHDAASALRLYDFDRCTGTLSNLRIIPYQEPLHSAFAAFSPNNRFLYLSRPGLAWSLDLEAADLSSSFDSISVWENNFLPTYPWSTVLGINQLGPDGKIYWSNWLSPTQALNVMHRPDLPGDAADLEEEGLVLPRWSDLGICQFPNYRLGKWESSPCDTLHFQGTSDGFVATPYMPVTFRCDSGYTLLPPIGGGACPDCTPRDLELLNNPMAAVYARLHLQLTGKLPDDWPREKAERSGLIIALPNHEHATTRKKDE